MKNQKNKFGANDLEHLDKILEKEDEECLLKRVYTYWSKEHQETKQITIGKPVDYFSSGVFDKRIKITKSNPNKLKGFVILVIGFHRILWRPVEEVVSNYKYDKAKCNTVFMQSSVIEVGSPPEISLEPISLPPDFGHWTFSSYNLELKMLQTFRITLVDTSGYSIWGLSYSLILNGVGYSSVWSGSMIKVMIMVQVKRVFKISVLSKTVHNRGLNFYFIYS
ncbi:hypothetical protein GLOIN_2v1476919 [Rhizophagus clarus]|uniref:Uncharacterized protein n=1 Tax=Rhizophagus clarus TaxID=94130 RepID=A0A8H3QNT3_9GLOM|nr:hypothetical protein GLOIN_2v1476919 [Rhizophagus clarus]